MGRILFFILLAFLVFMALRVLASKRKASEAEPPANDAKDASPQAGSPEAACALLPCPLCSIHMPQAELTTHLKQAHHAKDADTAPGS